MTRKQYALLFTISLVLSSVSAQGSEQVTTLQSNTQDDVTLKDFAKQPFYKDVPEIDQACKIVAETIGVKDLHTAFKTIPDYKPTEYNSINTVYKLVTRTPIKYYASQTTKGKLMKFVARSIMAHYFDPQSIINRYADDMLDIVINKEFSIAGWIYKRYVQPVLPQEIAYNFWANAYAKDFFKDGFGYITNGISKKLYAMFESDIEAFKQHLAQHDQLIKMSPVSSNNTTLS